METTIHNYYAIIVYIVIPNTEQIVEPVPVPKRSFLFLRLKEVSSLHGSSFI